MSSGKEKWVGLDYSGFASSQEPASLITATEKFSAVIWAC